MNTDTRKPQAKTVTLSWLKEHPRQAEFFSDTSEDELNELAQSLESHGQQERIHCCADGTLLRGHRRVAAAKILGWTKIKAIVRHDLEGPDDPRATEDLINDNLLRRQLDELALARCYRELKLSAEVLPSDAEGDVRDLLAERMNCGKSGRTLDRLEKLLELPRDIQDLVSNKTLSKSQAGAILKVPKTKQEKLYKELRKGGEVDELLRRFGVVKSPLDRPPAELAEEFLKRYHRISDIITADVTSLDYVRVRGVNIDELLEDAANFFAEWRDRMVVALGERDDKMEEVLSRMAAFMDDE